MLVAIRQAKGPGVDVVDVRDRKMGFFLAALISTETWQRRLDESATI
jgi:hypothetical protein